jgi:hypothetical protein
MLAVECSGRTSDYTCEAKNHDFVATIRRQTALLKHVGVAYLVTIWNKQRQKIGMFSYLCKAQQSLGRFPILTSVVNREDLSRRGNLIACCKMLYSIKVSLQRYIYGR